MTKSKEIKPTYEIEEIEDERIVFVGNINKKGKKPIEISRIKKTLPRTNLEFFSEEDFIRLKEIEKEILLSYKNEKKDHDFLRKFIKRFLEI
jgi:hypothetical protein